MAKKRISEEQARKIVQEVADGAKPADLAKKYGFSLGTYYNWRAKFGGAKPKAKKKAAAKPAKKRGRKPAAKKRGRKPAAAKAVAKAAPKKRGRKPAAAKAVVKAAPKKRGRKPAAAKRGRKPAVTGASAIKAKIVALQGQIKSAQDQIAKLKVAYADAVFG